MGKFDSNVRDNTCIETAEGAQGNNEAMLVSMRENVSVHY